MRTAAEGESTASRSEPGRLGMRGRRTPSSRSTGGSGLFVLLWLLFLVVLAVEPARLDAVWAWFRDLPMVAQVVGWVPVTPVEGLTLPYWAGTWFGLCPPWQGLVAQAAAGASVVGSDADAGAVTDADAAGERHLLVAHQRAAVRPQVQVPQLVGRVRAEEVELHARVAQRALPVLELGLEAAERPLGEVLVEIGDHADGVRQRGALVERAAALEVDEHEREVVGVVVGVEVSPFSSGGRLRAETGSALWLSGIPQLESRTPSARGPHQAAADSSSGSTAGRWLLTLGPADSRARPRSTSRCRSGGDRRQWLVSVSPCNSALTVPRQRWRPRAASTRPRTAALGSPGGPCNWSQVGRGTSICRSMRSRSGPETRVR